jgi:RimJ/RimL family protein N-acetyltransferase
MQGIYQLSLNDYETTRPLFQGLEYNVVVRAVIEGTNPGRIYADDRLEPKSAFLCSAEGYYLAGVATNQAFNTALHRLIADRIFAGDTVRPGDDQIDLRFCPGTWEEALAVILQGKPPLQQRRRHYIWRERRMKWQERIPEGCTVRHVDDELLAGAGIGVSDSALNRYAVDKMKANWGSIESFVERGFGFCTLCDEQVVSWCIADCASGNACEIGIRTHPDYRRRGLASVTVAAAADYALSHGFAEVGWHCWEGNAGSIGVAEKVGFEMERQYVAYARMFDDATHLAEVGLAHFVAGEYQLAVESYDKAFALRRDPFPHQYYHLAARAWAALGNRERATSLLHQAIDQGENRLDYTQGCAEFAILHGTSGWLTALERLRATRPRARES